MAEFAYAGKILWVDLSTGAITTLPTAAYADRFIGGRGIGAKIYWDEVPPQIGAYDPQNRLIFTTGPAAGFARLAGSRWQVCGKSPSTRPAFFSYANLGGSWGSRLKFAGFDGLVVYGKAKKPVYLSIDSNTVQIKDATHLWGRTTTGTFPDLRAQIGEKYRIVTIGPAGENRVAFATLVADDDSTASGGFGSVMGSKNLKAIAVAGSIKPEAADPARLKQLADLIFKFRKGTWDVYPSPAPGRTRRKACYGCAAGCLREYYRMNDGQQVKFFCQAGDFYRKAALSYYGTWNETIVHATRLCNGYGLDTAVLQPLIEWLSNCRHAGILEERKTGLPLSEIGSYEFIDTLVKQIAFREGFGDLLAEGTIQAAKSVGNGSSELIGDTIATRASEMSDYDPRLFITTGLLYAVEPRRPIQQLHEISLTVNQWLQWLKGIPHSFLLTEAFLSIAERFWGSRAAADFSTYEGKALAAKKIQDRQYAKESLILCDFLWPITWVRHLHNHVGDPTLESRVYSTLTGNETDEKGLSQIGERIFNLQRSILIREGWKGRDDDNPAAFAFETPLKKALLNRDCLVPGKDGQAVSRKGLVLEKEEFETLKDEYYELRGWETSSGIPRRAKLNDIGLGDVADDLENLSDSAS